jgi:hypothetical protein
MLKCRITLSFGMNLNLRTILFVMNTLGACAALVIYIASFSRITKESIGLFLLLPFGWFFLNVLLLFVTAPEGSLKWWFDLWSDWPRWARWAARSLGVVWAAHLIVFFFQTGGGVPEIKDGLCVLIARGRVLSEISASEYRWLKGAELRLLAAFFLTAFLTMALEWWLRAAHPAPEADN